MLQQKQERILADSGISEKDTFSFNMNLQGEPDELVSLLKQDLLAIRALPSVHNASSTSSIPYSQRGGTENISLPPNPDEVVIRAASYWGSYNMKDTWKIEMLAGEWFKESDVFYYTDASESRAGQNQLVISQALAKKLFPDDWRQVVGEMIYASGTIYTVRGVAYQFPSSGWSWWENHWYGIITNANLLSTEPKIIVRAQPGMREQAMKDVTELLMKTPERWIDQMISFEQLRQTAHQNDAAVVVILVVMIVIISIATSLGIFAQVRFSIITRRKQIGTRRALGASKTQILRFFMLESFIICSVGVLIGITFSIIINVYLINTLSISPVPVSYLFIGALCMWFISQLATMQPVIQASRISPAIVTRSA